MGGILSRALARKRVLQVLPAPRLLAAAAGVVALVCLMSSLWFV